MIKKRGLGNPNWKPGQTGNPNGRPPDALNAAMKKLTKNELEDIATLIIKGDYKSLKKVAADENQSALKVMIAAVCVGIVNEQDMSALDKLLNRLIGKVKETVEVNNTGNMPTTVMLNIPDNGRAAKIPDDTQL